MNREHLKRLRDWLDPEDGCIDDGEELFNEVDTIVELIDFWLDKNKCVDANQFEEPVESQEEYKGYS